MFLLDIFFDQQALVLKYYNFKYTDFVFPASKNGMEFKFLRNLYA